MNSDKSTRKVILLIIAIVVIAILALIYAYILLFSSSNKTSVDNQYATFPESGTDNVPNILPIDDVNDSSTQPSDVPVDTEEPVVINNADWRDEVFDTSSNNVVNYDKSNAGILSDSGQQEIDDLYAAAEALSNYMPSYPSDSPLANHNPAEQMTFEEFDALTQAYYMPPQFVYSGVTNCGEINMPTNEDEYDRFSKTLHTNKSIICMGKAVANNCAKTELSFYAGETEQILYLAKRDDNVCAIGQSFEGVDYMNLCSFDKVMNVVANKNKNITEWQSDFSKEPGENFSKLFTSSLKGFSEQGATESLDCKKYKL